MSKNRQIRNLKLFKTYQKHWTRAKNKALLHLSQEFSIKGQPAEEVKFQEKRISIMNHDRKQDEKNQILDNLKLIQSRKHLKWENNLRSVELKPSSKNSIEPQGRNVTAAFGKTGANVENNASAKKDQAPTENRKTGNSFVARSQSVLPVSKRPLN